MNYYNRDGQPITTDQWVQLLTAKDYKILAHTVMSDGQHMISTVWLGLDHNFMSGPLGNKLIFETMIFAKDGMSPVEGMQWRYTTEAQAMAGHLAAYQMLRSMYDNGGIIDGTVSSDESELHRFDGSIPITSSSNDGGINKRSPNVQGNVVRSIRSRQNSSRNDDSAGHNPTGKGDIVYRHSRRLGVVKQSPRTKGSHPKNEVPEP